MAMPDVEMYCYNGINYIWPDLLLPRCTFNQIMLISTWTDVM